MINKGLFTSNTGEWETPQDFFDELNKEFNFTFDVCATKENAKCKRFWTKENNALTKDWNLERFWMNPPYGREIGKWIKKAATKRNGIVVALLPARTDTRWFHDYIYKKPYVEIKFIKGRLKFGGAKNSAPFPSMLVIFK
jgi:phage N-6-adenine-methyltransferase